MPKQHNRLVALVDRVDAIRAAHEDTRDLIERGTVLVDGAIVVNIRARIPRDASVRVQRARPLRGTRKLRAALDHFRVRVRGRVALDVGAAAGGFTSELVERGAIRVYAVD